MEMEDLAGPLTCILCHNYFDRKPSINSFPPEEQPVKFKKGLKLLCKLLNVLISGESERLLNGEDGDDSCHQEGYPCCVDCNLELLDLLRLENIIKETQAKQREILGPLKIAIVDNQHSHKCQFVGAWAPLRAELVQGLTTRFDDVFSHQVHVEANNDNYFDEEPLFLDNDSESSYVLPEIELPQAVPGQCSPSSTPLESDSLSEPPAKRGRPRKQVLSTRLFSRDEVKVETTTLSPIPVRPTIRRVTKPCSVSLVRINVEDYTPVQRKGRGRPMKTKQCGSFNDDSIPSRGQVSGKQNGVNCANVFYLITDQILLFQNTPIKFEPVGLTCLDCTHFVEGSDYFGFQNMKAHVYECRGGGRIFRGCPLCSETFTDGKSVRNHIVNRHTPNRVISRCTVICISCFKPMPYYCYLYHTWLHKNDNEKVESLARGEQIATNVKNQLGLKGLITRPHGKGQGVHYNNVYYLITEELFLFKDTPVKFTPSEFICLEPECSYSVPGSDYFTFQNMRAHVNECHTEGVKRKGIKSPCPLCPEKLMYGKPIRNHILSEHTPHRVSTRSTVVCESCWKPQPFYCLLYHIWFHKSEEEKQSALQGCEPISTKVKVMLGLMYKNGRIIKSKPLQPTLGSKYTKKPAISSSSSDESDMQLDSNLDPDYVPEPHSSEMKVDDSSSSVEHDVQSHLVIKPEIVKATRCKTKKMPLILDRIKLKRTGAKIKRAKHGQGPGVNFKSVFYQITETCLLFQNTLLKYQPNGFKCLEPECSFFAPGSDYFTFENTRVHVKECHGEEYDSQMVSRSCLFCHEAFTEGKLFRNHIFNEHTSDRVSTRCTVICQSCAKPMPYYCFLHHVWSHKSEDEKQATIQSGEPISGKVKVQLGLVDKNMTQDKFKDGNYFFALGDHHLFYKGIIIEFSPHEFICREGGCSVKINGSDYDTFTKFQKHAEDHHHVMQVGGCETKPFERICPVCNLEFFEWKSFKLHIFDEHSPNAVCTSCWKPLKTYSGITRHVLLHMNESEKEAAMSSKRGKQNRQRDDFCPVRGEVFSCETCSRQFGKLTNLRAHEKTHVPNHLRRKYSCTECNFSAFNRVSIRAHVESKHKPELAKKKLECRICGREFNHRYGHKLRIHMRSHTGETPYVCEVCGKGFISQETLKNHSKSVHITDRPYQCEFCEKNYKQDYVLKLHQRRVHKGLVPQTSRNSILTEKHRLELIGPKIAFPCEFCGRLFPFKSRLKYHVKTSHLEYCGASGSV